MASQQQQSSQHASSVPGSQVQTITSESRQSERGDGQTQHPAPRILRLRGQNSTNGRSVQWAEDVVDNEGLGRKSSKVCCIYHKPRAVGDSSDESSSSSSSSGSDSDMDARARRTPSQRGAKDDNHADHDCGHNHSAGGREGRRSSRRKPASNPDGSKSKRKPSPNAYEKIPKVKGKEEGER